MGESDWGSHVCMSWKRGFEEGGQVLWEAKDR